MLPVLIVYLVILLSPLALTLILYVAVNGYGITVNVIRLYYMKSSPMIRGINAMPKQHRWAIKRTLDQSIEAIRRSQEYLAAVGIEFEPVHPEISAELKTIYVGLSTVIEAIDYVKAKI